MDAQITTKLATIQIASVEVDGLASIACRVCGAPLDVCQPDPNLPDRFLATCPDCLTWFLVESSTDQAEIQIASLAPLVGLGHPQNRRQAPR
jgi:hypothetical protein